MEGQSRWTEFAAQPVQGKQSSDFIRAACVLPFKLSNKNQESEAAAYSLNLQYSRVLLREAVIQLPAGEKQLNM